MKNIPNGVYPTMITPFTSFNRIDYTAVEKLLQWYADRNVDGIFAICQSSEIFFLEFWEKLELLRFIIKHKPKGVTILASGHTADDLSTQVEHAKAYIQEGIDAYVFIANRFASKEESDDVLLHNMLAMTEQLGSDIPLGIYECPYPYKRLMTPEILRELVKTGRFCFLKDTCCNIEMIRARLDALQGSGFKLFNANSATLLESLQAGAAGFSGVMGNIHPELYVWLCKNFAQHPQEAQLMQDFVGFASMAECQMYPVNAKYYLQLEGLPISSLHCRNTNASLFTRNRQLEIAQMRSITEFFKQHFPLSV